MTMLPRYLSIAAIVAAAIFLSMYIMTCNHNKGLQDKNDQLASILKAQEDSTHYVQNALGEEVARRRVAEATKDLLAQAYNIQLAANKLGVTKEDLINYTEAVLAGQSHVRPADSARVVYRDRVDSAGCPVISYMQQNFRSPYYAATARVGDSAYLNITSYDTVSVGMSWQVDKKGFLGIGKQAHPVVTVRNANPDIRQTITQSFQAIPKAIGKPRWTLGIFRGGGYGTKSDFSGGLINGLQRPQGFLGLGIGRNVLSW